MATIGSVTEEAALNEPDGTKNEPAPAARPGSRDEGPQQDPSSTMSASRQRGPLLGSAALVAIITALIASLSLAAVTAFNTLRADITLLRDEMRDEFAAVREEIGGVREEVGSVREEIGGVREEIGSVRSDLGAEIADLRHELRDFRGEVTRVHLDHTDRLARLEALHTQGPHVHNQEIEGNGTAEPN